MPKLTLTVLVTLIAAISAAVGPARAETDSGNPLAAQTTRPAGYKPMVGDPKLGARLWKDNKLSTNGMSCYTCHANHGAFQASFAQPYPHTVQMAKNQLGRKVIHLDEMIQGCMIMPMEAKPFPWNSRELAALVAYVQLEQKSFKPATNASR